MKEKKEHCYRKEKKERVKRIKKHNKLNKGNFISSLYPIQLLPSLSLSLSLSRSILSSMMWLSTISATSYLKRIQVRDSKMVFSSLPVNQFDSQNWQQVKISLWYLLDVSDSFLFPPSSIKIYENLMRFCSTKFLAIVDAHIYYLWIFLVD